MKKSVLVLILSGISFLNAQNFTLASYSGNENEFILYQNDEAKTYMIKEEYECKKCFHTNSQQKKEVLDIAKKMDQRIEKTESKIRYEAPLKELNRNHKGHLEYTRNKKKHTLKIAKQVDRLIQKFDGKIKYEPPLAIIHS